MAGEDLGQLSVEETAREPEKLVLPAGGVQYLLELALRTELGGAFWRGFVTAHGAPTWIVAGALSLKAQDAEVVRMPGTPGGRDDMGDDPALPPPADAGTAPHGAPYGRWCPFCGADLSHVPVREEPPEEAVFAAVGRRLKTALAVGFVLVWMAVSLYDFVLV